MLAFQKKWQDAWKKAKLFEANPDTKKKFFITIPYPYISGSLHIGHARVVTEADVYARFLRMQGMNVLFPIAFHISGTPVLGISLALKNKDKEKTELYKNYVRNYIHDEKKVEKIVASFTDPQNIVDFFIPLMEEEFATLGLSVDWRRSFTSGDKEHQKLVEWQFRKYKKKGYLVQGKYPVLYSESLGNAVGEDDIIDGDIDPVEKQEFVLVKFPYKDKFLIAATLRPETLYGQTNLWVNPDVSYAGAKVGKEIWIASKECFAKLALQEYDITIVETILGKELLGKKCHAPFLEKDILILPSSHCDPHKGTGIVTSVPSDAPFDWIALHQLQESEEQCKKYHLPYNNIKKIQPIPIISSKGYGAFPAKEICQKRNIHTLDQHQELAEATQEIYKTGFHTGVMTQNCGLYAGMPTAQAREDMKKELLKKKNSAILFETSRPAKARDGSPVVVAVLDKQWFLDFAAAGWKEEAHQALKQMLIIPEKYRKQFEDTFLWLDKRPCARRRGLGTKLPFDTQWVIESLSDSTIYMALYPICYKLRAYKLQEEHLTEEFFDYVLLGQGRKKDIVQTGIKETVLDDLRKEFSYWYPFDHRHTFTAHLSNHLSFMLFAHAAIFPQSQWPKKVTFHGMVISEGMKMSKSKGNVVTLLDVNKQYGADVFRAFMCYATNVESTFNWETKEVEKMKIHLEALYRLLEECMANRKKAPIPVSAAAFVSQLERAIMRATDHVKAMELRDYATIVLFELFAKYRRLVQKCSRSELAPLNEYVLPRWLLLLAPLTPHLAEELWKKTGNKGFISTASWPVADQTKIDPLAEYKESFIENVEQDIHTVCKLAQIPKPKEISLFIADHWKYDFFALMKDLLHQTRDMKAIMASLMKTPLRAKSAEIAKLVPLIIRDPAKIPPFCTTPETEYTALHEQTNHFADALGCPLKVSYAEKTTEAKAAQALPGKPAILVR